MRVSQRIDRLENRLQVGTNRDGTCRYCSGREVELGRRVVVVRETPDPDGLDRLFPPRPQPPPTLCPRCGRDVNLTVIVRHVDMIAKRRAEVGWVEAARAGDRVDLDE